MRSKSLIILLLSVLMLLSACTVWEKPQSAPTDPTSENSDISTAESAAISTTENTTVSTQPVEAPVKKTMLKIEIGDSVLLAELADTAAAETLKEKLTESSVTIAVSNYGDWEKVGELPWSLPAADVYTTAQLGDIMLYRGNSIVLFYGSNSWDYTKLGTIADADVDALSRILGGGDTELTLSLVNE